MTMRGSGDPLVFGKPDEGSPEGFRFSAAGVRVVLAPLPESELGAASWVHPEGAQSFAHGDGVRMRVEAAHLEGCTVRFVVEHSTDGATWSEYEVIEARVEHGAAEAPLEVHHPVFSRHNEDPHEDDVAAAPPARLRFHAHLAGG
jgi:hypothetical protein